MKAIHNRQRVGQRHPVDVVTMSKIGKMKAIHNRMHEQAQFMIDVVTMSKIGKMKAIHNKYTQYISKGKMLWRCQR